MGDTHFRSNIAGKDGTETISNFATISGTTITGSTSVTGTSYVTGGSVRATNYIKLGSHKYIFEGDAGTEATIVAAATAVDASCKGSLYMGPDTLWLLLTDSTASQVQAN